MSFDELRLVVAKVDALANATEELFDSTTWRGEVDSQRLERIAHLVGATAEAAAVAVVAVDSFNAEVLVTPTISTDTDPDDWG